MENFWGIHDLERKVSNGLITTASFSCFTSFSGSDGYGTHTTVGEAHLPVKSDTDTDFVEYANLTENRVLGWITGSIGKAEIELANSSSIAENINYELAKTIDSGTPWS